LTALNNLAHDFIDSFPVEENGGFVKLDLICGELVVPARKDLIFCDVCLFASRLASSSIGQLALYMTSTSTINNKEHYEDYLLLIQSYIGE
jgi:hypothetical protein